MLQQYNYWHTFQLFFQLIPLLNVFVSVQKTTPMNIRQQLTTVSQKIARSLLLKIAIAVSIFSFGIVFSNCIGVFFVTKNVLGEYFGNQLREKIHSQHVIGENALMTLNAFIDKMPKVFPDLGQAIADENFDYIIQTAQQTADLISHDGYIITDAEGNIKFDSYQEEYTNEQTEALKKFVTWLSQKNDLTYNGYINILNKGICVVSAHALPDINTMQIKATFIVVQLQLCDNEYLKRTGDMLQITGTVFDGTACVGSSLFAGGETVNFEMPQTWIADTVYQKKQPVATVDEYNGNTFISAYAPIPNYDGSVIGIYNAGVDITVLKSIISIVITTLLIAAVTIGALLLWLILRYFRRNIVNPITSLNESAQHIADGDLTQEVRIIHTHDEIERLCIGMHNMQTSLKDTISTIARTSDFLHSASEGLSRSSLQLSDGANKQAASLEEVSSSLEEMAGNIHQNKDNANITEKQMAAADKAVQQIADSATTSMNDTQKIASSIRDINALVNQTNILSLNASVEAARAGNMGRGFAVVAKEVGRLAEQTKITAFDISKKAETSIVGTQNINTLLDEVTPQLHQVSALIKEIAVSSQEQSIGADQINLAIADLNRVTQESAANAEEIAANAEELSGMADKMKQIVGTFKI